VLLHNVLKKVISFTKERLKDVNVFAVAEARHLTVINQPVKTIKVDPMDDFYMFIPEDVFAKRSIAYIRLLHHLLQLRDERLYLDSLYVHICI
jgi:hypothetical protein